MQQIYRRTPKPKCDFNMQLYWNRTSAWLFSCKSASYFRTPFPRNTYGWLLLKEESVMNFLMITMTFWWIHHFWIHCFWVYITQRLSERLLFKKKVSTDCGWRAFNHLINRYQYMVDLKLNWCQYMVAC